MVLALKDSARAQGGTTHAIQELEKKTTQSGGFVGSEVRGAAMYQSANTMAGISAMTRELQSLHALQAGQAMGMRLGVHPMTGQMEWMKGGKGGGAGAKGAGEGAAGLFGRFAGPAAIGATALHTLEMASKANLIATDRHLTEAQKEREGFKQLVPFGERIMGVVDSFSGRTQEMGLVHEQARYAQAATRGRTAQYGFELGFNPHQAGLSAYAKSFAGQMPAIPPIYDRSSAGGEQQYRDAMRLLPLKQETLKTERELAKAASERGSAEMEQVKIARRINELKTESASIRPQLNDGSGPDLLRKQERFKNIQEEIQQLAPMQQQTLQGAAEARSREAQARGANEKAKLREDVIGRAEFFQDRADTARGTATRLGQMDPLERAQAAQAVLMAKRGYVDALPPEYKALAAGIAPKEMEKIFENAGANSGAYKTLREAGVVDAPNIRGYEKPSALQKRADELRHEAGEKEFHIDQESAEGIAKAAKENAMLIAGAIKAYNDAMRLQIFAELRIGRNQ